MGFPIFLTNLNYKQKSCRVRQCGVEGGIAATPSTTALAALLSQHKNSTPHRAPQEEAHHEQVYLAKALPYGHAHHYRHQRFPVDS
jgi:hypothetical protein